MKLGPEPEKSVQGIITMYIFFSSINLMAATSNLNQEQNGFLV